MGVVGGQNFGRKHGIDTGSDISVGKSGHGLEARTGPTIDAGSDVSNGEGQWAWFVARTGPTIDTGSDVSNGEGQWAWFGARTGLR